MTDREMKALAAASNDLESIPFGDPKDGRADEPAPEKVITEIVAGVRAAFRKSRAEGVAFVAELAGRLAVAALRP